MLAELPAVEAVPVLVTARGSSLVNKNCRNHPLRVFRESSGWLYNQSVVKVRRRPILVHVAAAAIVLGALGEFVLVPGSRSLRYALTIIGFLWLWLVDVS